MLRVVVLLAVGLGASADEEPEWKVTKAFFSAVTIGIDFMDESTGWTTQTNGAELPKVVKSEDGGASWHEVASDSGEAFLPVAIAASKGDTKVATYGPLFSAVWSEDGDNFKQSLGEGIAGGQDINYQDGRFVAASGNGVCISETGERYTCRENAPLKRPGSGRYSSSPVVGTIYLVAGEWPEEDPATNLEFGKKLSQHVSVSREGRFQHVKPATKRDANDTYTLELWKSTDDGETWRNLIAEEGDFYPNEIHCYDETHCVIAAEGEGVRVYYTSDGENFNVVYESGGLASLMAAHMLSPTEYWVGGASQPGSPNAPSLILHSVDGGQTHTDHGLVDELRGEYVSAMSFVSPTRGWATSLNAAGTCNLMEFGGPNPPSPAPAPPTPGSPHYEKPPCKEDEEQASITGEDGICCLTPCYASGGCPTDKPEGVTAFPTCAVSDSSTGELFCALFCLFDGECDEAGGAACNGGLCLYNDTSGGAANRRHMHIVTPTVTV